jgi:hypothetical protein
MHRREERAIRDEAKAFVAEAEATLTGRLVDWCWFDDNVPGWVWLNTLAHADWAALGDLADGGPPGRHSIWNRAVMFLAGELLSTAGSADGLIELQRACLIPLESDLLAAPSWTLSSPAELVSLVRSELRRSRLGGIAGPQRTRSPTGAE